MTEGTLAVSPDGPRGVRADYETGESLAATLDLLLAPHHCFRRALERIELRPATIRREVTFELHLDRKHVLVPIMIRRRGALLDTLSLGDSDGVADFTLHRRETKSISRKLIRFALHLALDGKGFDQVDVDHLERLATNVVMRKSGESDAFIDSLTWMRDFPLPQDAGRRGYGDAVRMLAKHNIFYPLAKIFHRHRLVLVPVWADEYLKVDFSYEQGLGEATAPGLAQPAREALGHSPYDFRIPLPFHARVGAYHLRFVVPDEMYVRDFGLITNAIGGPPPHTTWRKREVRKLRRDEAAVQGDGTSTSGLAHLYVPRVRLTSPEPQHLFARLVLNERPLGSVGGAVARALLVVAIVLVVLRLGAELVVDDIAGPVAVLLALPGLLSLRGRIDARPNRRPLLVGVSAAVTIGSAVGSALLYLWWVSDVPTPDPGKPVVSFACPDGILNWFKAILAVLGATVVYGTLRLGAGFLRYVHARVRTRRVTTVVTENE